MLSITVRAVKSLPAVFLFVCVCSLVYPAEPVDPAVQKLLVELDRVANLYRDSALGFTCNETVHLHTDDGRRTVRLRYIYSRTPDGTHTDHRLRRKDRGPGELVALGDLGIDRALVRVYSWVFLFESSRWPHYRYEIRGEEVLDGMPALKITLDPIEPFHENVNEWQATVWVDRETHLPLRVEALSVRDREAQQAYLRALAADSRSWTPYTWEESTTLFGVKHHGLRYPSEARIEMASHTVPSRAGGRGRRLYAVRQLYTDYRFFKTSARDQLEQGIE